MFNALDPYGDGTSLLPEVKKRAARFRWRCAAIPVKCSVPLPVVVICLLLCPACAVL
jgi:hypothetical protein